jgi:hypothetical protein
MVAIVLLFGFSWFVLFQEKDLPDHGGQTDPGLFIH